MLSKKYYTNAYTSKFEVHKKENIDFIPKKQEHCTKFISGCIYDSEGAKVFSSERVGATAGDHVASYNPEFIEVNNHKDITMLNAESIYLGPWMNHYGHFITETLSKFWFYNDSHRKMQLLYHPFIFSGNITDSSYQAYLLKCLGIDYQRISIIEAPLLLKKVYIPDSAWNINMKAAPQASRVYEKIRGLHKSYLKYDKIFLSIKKSPSNRIENIHDIEEVFRNMGFLVFYPEDLSIQKQLSMYANCNILAGFSGSSLHNCLFTYANTLIIELSDKRTKNRLLLMQEAAIEISQNNIQLIPYLEDETGLLDIKNLEKKLRLILR